MKRARIIMVILLMVLLMGCNKNTMGETENGIKEQQGEEAIGIPSPISGLYALREKVERRPMAIMFDNHPKARWQSGLSQAEIVYEYLVEAPYTRYMGIFLINEPESIGPIRSARPYFVSSLMEYDSIYVRVGGSRQADEDVLAFKVDEINGMSAPSSVLGRTKEVNKIPPHNTYTSMERLRSYQREKGYREIGDYIGFKFNNKDKDLDGFDAETVLIKYYGNNTTLYSYDPEEKEYTREKDGEVHIDEADNSLIKVKNIIIQEAETKLIGGSGSLSIEVVGEGRGSYISNGKGIAIKWVKESRSDKTYYYDENGREIVLNPGTTWFQMVKPDTPIDIE